MNRQHELLVDMLREIRDICEANGIQYFVGYGTLIGAVRNEGFLPWDDDIDVIMTYDNYQLFKQACKTQLPPNRYLGCPDEDPEYGHLLPRYISTDSTAIHTAQSLTDTVSGELIDIFVLEPIADSEEDYHAYLQDLYLYTTLLNYANVAAFRVNLDPDLYREYAEREKAEGTLAIRRELEQKLASHHSEEGSQYVVRWQGAPIKYQRSWFEDTVMVPFEGQMMTAPKHIGLILSYYYGEEWVEVPGDIKPAKHNTAQSMDFGYKDALTYYRPKFDRAELLEATKKRRVAVLTNAPGNNHQRDQIVAARAKAVKLSLERRLAAHRAEFDAAWEAKDGQVLETLLHDYLAFQISTDAIGRITNLGFYQYLNPVMVDVSDQVLEAGLYALIATGHIRHAHILLRKRHQLGLASSAGIQALEDAIDLLNTAMDDYQFERTDAGLQKAHELHGAYPKVDAFLKLVTAFLWQRYEAQPTPENLQAFKAKVDEGLSAYPGDGFFIKELGDWHYAQGEDEMGRTRYLQAAELTRNGLALLDIAKKTGYHPTWLRNASWSEEAGVPQWSGSLPEIPEEFKKKPVPKAVDERQTFMVNLMAEVTDLCDKLSVDYILGPSTARALFKQGVAPAELNGCQVVVRREGLRKLLAHWSTQKPANRSLESMATVDGFKGREVRYHADNTVAIDLKKDTPNGFNSLYVRIVPLEPEAYDSAFENTLKQWDSGNMESAKGGKKAFLKALVHKLGNKRRNGAALLDQALEAPAKDSMWLRIYKTPKHLSADFMDQTSPRRFGELSFKVPADFEGYMDKMKPKAVARKLSINENTVCSTAMTCEELLNCGVLDADFFKRRNQLRLAGARERAILKDFRFNFQQVKLAVELKKLADALLPRKNELLALGRAGEYEQLGAIFKKYLKVAETYADYGDANFDDELFALMKETRKHLG